PPVSASTVPAVTGNATSAMASLTHRRPKGARSFDARQRLVSMERRRRRQRPFERRRPGSPRIGGRALAPGESLRNAEQEDQEPGEGHVGTDRGDEVPTGEGIRIIRIAARHAGEAEKMLREEGEV